MRIKDYIALIFVVFFSGCVPATTSLDMLDEMPMYDGAFDITQHKFSSNSKQQLSYKVKQPYPSTEVLAYYDKYFVGHGWKKCIGEIEGWQSFTDASNTPESVIYQIAHYYIKENEGSISTVFLHYSSNRINEPDNDIQNVVILMQRNIDLRKILSQLDITC